MISRIILWYIENFFTAILSRRRVEKLNKGGVVTNYKRIEKERMELQEQLKNMQKQLSQLPEGKLICSRNENRYKWYQSNDGEKIYIPKSQRSLAEKLAIKKYLSLKLEEINQRIRVLDSYLNNKSQNMEKAQEELLGNPGYAELLTPFFTPLSEELSLWATAKYEHNHSYMEQLLHKTVSGNMVRSKSEAMIDMLLYSNRIPFRYECALQLEEITLFPDFTIRHPKTGKYFYWEHFGRMDDPAYYKNVYSKLHLYNSNGIIPSINLITTYETKEEPLSSEVIEKIIEHYFL